MNINCDIISTNKITEFKYLVLISNFERKIRYANKQKIKHRKKSSIILKNTFSGIFATTRSELFTNNVL